MSCDINPKYPQVLSVGEDESIRVWDQKTGEQLAALYVSAKLLDCAWLSDGQRIVVVGDRGVYFLRFVNKSLPFASN